MGGTKIFLADKELQILGDGPHDHVLRVSEDGKVASFNTNFQNPLPLGRFEVYEYDGNCSAFDLPLGE